MGWSKRVNVVGRLKEFTSRAGLWESIHSSTSMVGSYDVKHVDISESEGYCGSDNNIDLQNLLAYHHCLSKFRQDEAKIGQSPALCNNWTPTWSMWMPHSWSLDPGSRIHCFSWVINQSMYFPRRRGPGIYDIDPLTLGTTPRCFFGFQASKGSSGQIQRQG
jgi:hypothetical protein